MRGCRRVRIQPSGPPEGVPSWEPWVGEPSKWFFLFEQFRELGPQRTVQMVWDARKIAEDREQTRQKRPKTASHTWYDMAALWQWKVRAEAWDRHVLAEKRRMEAEAEARNQQAFLEEAARNKEDRLRLHQHMFAILVEAVKEFKPETAKFGELLTLYKLVMEQFRIEYNDQPEYRYSLTAEDADERISILKAFIAGFKQHDRNSLAGEGEWDVAPADLDFAPADEDQEL